MTHNIFSGRELDYEKFRTPYAQCLADFLSSEIQISDKDIIADIGSGTGLLSMLLLNLGARVFGVEPNKQMRLLGEKNLGHYRNFISIAGSAEHTNLPDHSVNIISAGNAFHWFDPLGARQEFKRILKPNSLVLLIRSDWKQVSMPHMQTYDKIIGRYCVGRTGIVSDPKLEERSISKFFDNYKIKNLGVSNYLYNKLQLKGRFLSTSFAPQLGHREHKAAMNELDMLFDEYAENEKFSFHVITTVICGKFS